MKENRRPGAGLHRAFFVPSSDLFRGPRCLLALAWPILGLQVLLEQDTCRDVDICDVFGLC